MKKSPVLPRILVLTSTFPRWQGDTEPPFVLELCRRLTAHFEMHVLAPHSAGTRSQELFNGIRVTRFRYFFPWWENLAYRGGILANLYQNPFRYALVPFFLFSQIHLIRRLIIRYQYDLIHAHWLIPQGFCADIATLTTNNPELPILCTSHGGDLYGLSSAPMKNLKRRVLQRSNAVTVVSRKMKDDIGNHGIDLRKIHVIPMGVDLFNRFTPPREKKPGKRLLFVGRVVKKKGLRFLIEAMPKILEQHPDTKLRVAGMGQELCSIIKLSKKLGVEDHIRFLGAVANEDLPELYQTSDIVVFPSIVATGGDREGFGLVLVESLGCECAVVSTDLPATRDIVRDGVTALIVNQKDSRHLADGIIRLLDDSELRAYLGRRGRQHVAKQFDWRKISARYVDLIRSLIQN